MYSDIITNDPICKEIVDRFITEHPDLKITTELVKIQLEKDYKDSYIEIDAYSNFIEKWRKRKGFRTDTKNISQKLLLIITEVCEATEADRKGDNVGIQEELADTYIRLMDLTSALKYQMNRIIRVKMALNEFRPSRHGKKY